MMGRNEAVQVFQAFGLKVSQAHEEELRRFSEQTGTVPLPNIDPSYAKWLRKEVKRSRSVEDAIRPPMVGFSQACRENRTHPLIAIMGYQQNLNTLSVLATSKYGAIPEIETVAEDLAKAMPLLLGLSE